MAEILVFAIISISVGNFSIRASAVEKSYLFAKILASTLGMGSTGTPSLIEISATAGALSIGIGSSSI